MNRQTQKTRVIGKLREEGRVDNFWAFGNYILRLGAIIHGLREDGWHIDGGFGTGQNRKNYIYTLVEEPIRKHVTI